MSLRLILIPDSLGARHILDSTSHKPNLDSVPIDAALTVSASLPWHGASIVGSYSEPSVTLNRRLIIFTRHHRHRSYRLVNEDNFACTKVLASRQS
jgi:hypothetical protein